MVIELSVEALEVKELDVVTEKLVIEELAILEDTEAEGEEDADNDDGELVDSEVDGFTKVSDDMEVVVTKDEELGGAVDDGDAGNDVDAVELE